MNEQQKRNFFVKFSDKYLERLIFRENKRHLESFEAFEQFCEHGSDTLFSKINTPIVSEAIWLSKVAGQELFDEDQKLQPPITFYKVVYKRNTQRDLTNFPEPKFDVEYVKKLNEFVKIFHETNILSDMFDKDTNNRLTTNLVEFRKHFQVKHDNLYELCKLATEDWLPNPKICSDQDYDVQTRKFEIALNNLLNHKRV